MLSLAETAAEAGAEANAGYNRGWEARLELPKRPLSWEAPEVPEGDTALLPGGVDSGAEEGFSATKQDLSPDLLKAGPGEAKGLLLEWAERCRRCRLL